MKYMKSTSTKSYSVNGYTIPANTRPDWLSLSKEKSLEIEQLPVVKGLIKAGSIIVTDKEPAELARTPGKLLSANGQLAAENASLKAEVEKLKAEKEAVLQGNEAAQALEAVQAEKAELQKQIEAVQAEKAELQKQFDELKKEAEETIASLQKKKAKKEGEE